MKNEIVSIRRAISLLGVTVTINIVCGFLLKQALGESPTALPRFWDTAENVARACAYIARRLNIMDADPPYTLGLFHDAGIPLMAQRFSGYLDILRAANDEPGSLFTDLEDQHYHSNHAVVGFVISRDWGLPKDLREAILLHHPAWVDRNSIVIDGSVNGEADPVRSFPGRLSFRVCRNYTMTIAY